MDFNQIDKEFQKLLKRVQEYFLQLEIYGMVGWGLIGLSVILMIIAIIL